MLVRIDTSKVERVTESGCHLWVGRVGGNGYGQVRKRIDGKRRYFYAHRIAWEQANGPIPAGLCVCHRCDVPSCVNPAHLFVGTQAENVADRDRKGRGRAAKGALSGVSKLTEEQVLSIKKDGRVLREIAADYGIGKSQVSRIKRNETWEHLL